MGEPVRLEAICALCDETHHDMATHYAAQHPERHAGDWELLAWPDGIQVLVRDDTEAAS